jgi:hypothetical protein
MPFMGFDHPNMKAYMLLQQNGRFTTSRHVLFDESAPPAADVRADFSRHLHAPRKVKSSVQREMHGDDSSSDSDDAEPPAAQPSAAAPAAVQPQPITTPAPAAQPSASQLTPPPAGLPSPPAVSPPSPLIGQQNPLFKSDDGSTPSPPETRIPQGPRRSSRSNCGVIDRYDPSAYASFTTGLPSLKHVRFNPVPAEWVFLSQGSPQNPKPSV